MKVLCLLTASAALAQVPAKPTLSPMQEAMEKQRAAATVQREAVRKQVEMAAQWRAPANSNASSAVEAPEPDCTPITEIEVTPMIDAAAQTHGVQPKLLRAVMEQESAMRPCAVSPKGARGLMQLMPGTAGELGVDDPFDARQNIDGGAKFLKQLLDKYKGDVSLALGAYNAGPAAVDQTGKVPDIPETLGYVASILKKLAIPPTTEPKPPAPIVPPR